MSLALSGDAELVLVEKEGCVVVKNYPIQNLLKKKSVPDPELGQGLRGTGSIETVSKGNQLAGR